METPNQMPNNLFTDAGDRQFLRSPRVVIGVLIVLAVSLAIVLSALANRRIEVPGSAHLAAGAVSFEAFENLALAAKGAFIFDTTNGKTLFEKNPDVQLPLASLAKVPLALVVSDVLPLDSRITLSRDIPQIGKFETLPSGVPWPLHEVIDFTLITSSNDGAEILGEVANEAVRQKFTAAPAAHATLWRMNDLARELGLTQTYFLNMSGLDVSTTLSGAYGSARDVATLFAYANATNSSLFSGTARGNVLLTSEYGAQTTAYNTNEAEAEISGLILGKTGFTDLAGGNLAVVFDVGIAHPVVAVILGSTREGRFEDMRKLVEAARSAIAAQ